MWRFVRILLCIIFAFGLLASGASAGSHCGAKGDWRSDLIPDRWPPPKVRQGWVSRLGSIDIVPVFKACRKHDDCYDIPGVSRDECDRRFLKDMQKECDRTYQNILETPLNEACYQAAQGYYQAVSKFGGPAFAAARAGKSANSVKVREAEGKATKQSALNKNKAKAQGPPLIELKPWGKLEEAKSIAAMLGRLYAYKPEAGEIWVSPMEKCQWELFCKAPKATLLAAGQGRLYLWDSRTGEFFTTHINKKQWQHAAQLADVGSFTFCGHSLVCRLSGSGDLLAAKIWKPQWQKIGRLAEPSVLASFGGKLYAISMLNKQLSTAHLNTLAWKVQSSLNRFGLPAVYRKQVYLLDPANGEIFY